MECSEFYNFLLPGGVWKEVIPAKESGFRKNNDRIINSRLDGKNMLNRYVVCKWVFQIIKLFAYAFRIRIVMILLTVIWITEMHSKL